MSRCTICALLAVAACGGTPGAQPHDMSAAQHEAMAQQAEKGAASHQAMVDQEASAEAGRCGRSDFTPGTGVRRPVCWSSTARPTTSHLEEAEQYRKIAAEHRAASQVLRDAEASACAGLSEEDRDRSPFTHREDIASVQPFYGGVTSSKGQYAHLEGAIVTFRAVPGMTAQWLQRLIDCHLARSAALGHVMPEMPSCPLVPKGVTASVAPTGAGFAVSIRSDDVDSAREVLRRAQSLVQP